MILLIATLIAGMIIGALSAGISSAVQNARLNRPTVRPRETPRSLIFVLVFLCLVLPFIGLMEQVSNQLYFFLAGVCFVVGLILSWLMGPEVLETFLGARVVPVDRRRSGRRSTQRPRSSDTETGDSTENPFADLNDSGPTA
jgi:hypothetical protein